MKDPTPAHVLEHQRLAIAMSRAAVHGDQEGMQAIWDGAELKPALVWHLARLPGVVLASIGQDPDRILQEYLERLPLSIDTEEEK